MTATIMDGKRLAQEIRDNIKLEVKSLKEKAVNPCLATILVGDDPASKTYLKIKHLGCQEVGIQSRDYQLPATTHAEELYKFIETLNNDLSVHGILVQLPLPMGLNGEDLIEKIAPYKDVDGLHPINAGHLSYRKYELVPCTPKGIMTLLAHYKISLDGKHAVIINRSNLVGKPLSFLLSTLDPLQLLFLSTDILLLNADATVTICHSRTKNLEKYTRDADILVSAVGNRPDFIVTKDMVKDGVVIIDVGSSKIDGRTYGDVDFDSVLEKASYITPVPGGVGPMTVAILLHNTLIATAKQEKVSIKYDLKELWNVGKARNRQS
jgi:methylenetetrahydrofolate dehydrogenase (NADP+)/methenyltetrahydrofolate cyclohydrolase